MARNTSLSGPVGRNAGRTWRCKLGRGDVQRGVLREYRRNFEWATLFCDICATKKCGILNISRKNKLSDSRMAAQSLAPLSSRDCCQYTSIRHYAMRSQPRVHGRGLGQRAQQELLQDIANHEATPRKLEASLSLTLQWHGQASLHAAPVEYVGAVG